MPLLLRPSAPSPSIDQLAFTVPADPLAESLRNSGTTRSRAGTEPRQSQQLQRCSTHMRMSTQQRRSTEGNLTECSRKSGLCNDEADSVYHNSKRSVRESDPEDQDTTGSEYSEGGRPSTAPSCACSTTSEDLRLTSSTVVIEGNQLAVVDRELRALRKSFLKQMTLRITKMTRSFGGRKHITNGSAARK